MIASLLPMQSTYDYRCAVPRECPKNVHNSKVGSLREKKYMLVIDNGPGFAESLFSPIAAGGAYVTRSLLSYYLHIYMDLYMHTRI